VTWRDGGTECGFCDDGTAELRDGDEGYDEDDEDTWTGTCWYCKGTGVSRNEHSPLDGTGYYGIEIDNDTLRALILKHEVWGCLNEPSDMDTILAAREQEAA
jgi:hypothetical protein